MRLLKLIRLHSPPLKINVVPDICIPSISKYAKSLLSCFFLFRSCCWHLSSFNNTTVVGLISPFRCHISCYSTFTRCSVRDFAAFDSDRTSYTGLSGPFRDTTTCTSSSQKDRSLPGPPLGDKLRTRTLSPGCHTDERTLLS